MMLGARLGAWAPRGAPLPYDRPIEWIKGDGKAYIALPIAPQQVDSVECEVRFVEVSGSQVVFGAAVPNIWITNGLIRFNSNNTFNVLNKVSDRFVKVIVSYEYASYDGTPLVRTQSQWVEATKSIYLFAVNGRTDLRGLMYLKSFKWLRNGEVIFDGVPVAKIVDGVDTGFIYDKVSGEMFGNAGTGAFVIPT